MDMSLSPIPARQVCRLLRGPSQRALHSAAPARYLLKEKFLRSANPADQIRGLPPASHVFASILSSPPSMCHYTLRILPNALMIRFIFAEDPASEKRWFVPDGFIEPTRHGRGYWLGCRYRVVENFVKEKKYRKIDRSLAVREDLADHIITLFSIRIFQQLRALSPNHLRLKHEGPATPTGDVVGAVLELDSLEEDTVYGKVSPLNNYHSGLEAIPSYPLVRLIELGAYRLLLSLPSVQKLRQDAPRSKIEVLISNESVPLLCSLYRLASYLNNK